MPTVTALGSFSNGPGGNASYNINFSAQPVGTVLVLGHLSVQFVTATPTGWTRFGTDTIPYAYYKIADGTETSVTVAMVAVSLACGIVVGISNVGTPTDFVRSTAGPSATQTSDTHTGVPGAAASIAIFAGFDGVSTTQLALTSITGTNWASVFDVVISSGGSAPQLGLVIAANVSSLGSVSGATVTWNQSISTLAADSFYCPGSGVATRLALLLSI